MYKTLPVIASISLSLFSNLTYAIDSALIEELEFERTEMCVLDAVDVNVLQGEMYEYQSNRGRNPKEPWSEDSLKELEKQTGYGQTNSSLGNNHPLNSIASQIKSLNDRKRSIREPYDNRFKSACGDWCLEYKNSGTKKQPVRESIPIGSLINQEACPLRFHLMSVNILQKYMVR